MTEITQTSATTAPERQPSLLRRFAANLVCTLATGYILFVFSERMFWTVWRPGDRLAELVITWLAYCVAAYLFLAAASWFRANDFWSVFLAGALYGWIVEGGLIHTLYGTEPSAPFPISISITGLSWHALISVMLGWWATGRALTANRPRSLIAICVMIGIFWGVWAMFPRRETPPIVTPLPAFFLNAALLSLGLMVSWWVSFRAGLSRFRPGRIGILSCVAIVGLFFSQHVMRLGVLPLVLFPSVLCLALIPLEIHRRCRRSAPTNMLLASDRRSRALLLIGLIPLVATGVYWIAVACRFERFPVTTIVYYGLTGPMGFLTLVLAIVAVIRRSRKGEMRKWESGEGRVESGKKRVESRK